MTGAGLLFLTNLVAIVASAFLVFSLVGMSTREVQKEVLAARGDESPVKAGRALATGGRLRWRILMILILLAGIAVPLRRALLQVAKETIARGAVQRELKRVVPSNDIASQQVTVGKAHIIIRLISTQAIPDSNIAEVRQELKRRTGYDVQCLSMRSCAKAT